LILPYKGESSFEFSIRQGSKSLDLPASYQGRLGGISPDAFKKTLFKNWFSILLIIGIIL